LKNGWLFDCEGKSFDEVKSLIDKAVFVYNNIRPHQSIGNKTPTEMLAELEGAACLGLPPLFLGSRTPAEFLALRTASVKVGILRRNEACRTLNKYKEALISNKLYTFAAECESDNFFRHNRGCCQLV